MKSSITLFASLLFLCSACNNGDTNKTTPTGDTATTSSSTADSTNRAGNEPNDGTESTIPPEESATLKFGLIKEFHETNGALSSIDADYIQLYYGDKAVEVAKKHNDAELVVGANGDTTYALPGNIYMINDNTQIRKLTVAPNVNCYTLTTGKSEMRLMKSTLDQLRANWNNERVYILLLDRNNVVTGIKEQYLP